jgi:protein-tyrosine phosphatase
MTLYWIKTSLRNLAIIPRPRGWDWLADDLEALQREGIDAMISALTTLENEELGLAEETRLSSLRGIVHLSFPIEDRCVPASVSDFQEFLIRVEEVLASGKKVGVHCRAGIGRSSLIAASLLVRQGYSSDSAFRIIQEARGCAVPDTFEQREWVERFARGVTDLR